MNIAIETIDEQLVREIRRCSSQLVRKRSEKTRLETELSWPLPSAMRKAIQKRISELQTRGNVLDKRLDDLQKEQRLRAASRGKAIATCRIEWN